MIFTKTDLRDAWLLDLDRRTDDRGYFARTWCTAEFKAHGLKSSFVQANTAFNHHRGTLRGLHYQQPPHAEVKLVRCLRGAIYDVIVDLRSDSPTYKHWGGFELTQDNARQLYVPEGFAHGYLTLSDDTEVSYMVTAAYAPQAEGGARYDDPAFGIVWPEPVRAISLKDSEWPDYGS